MFKNPKFSSTETSSFNTLYRQLSFQKYFALELHKTSKNCKNCWAVFQAAINSAAIFNLSFIWNLSKPVFALLLNAVCLVEKQQIPINFIAFGLTWSGLEPMIYHTLRRVCQPLHHQCDAHNYMQSMVVSLEEFSFMKEGGGVDRQMEGLTGRT